MKPVLAKRNKTYIIIDLSGVRISFRIPIYIYIYIYIYIISGVTTMGSDRANLGAPNPNGPNGGHRPQAVEQNIGQGLWYVTMSFSDHHNSVKSLPKVGEMAFQRL